MIRPIAPAPPRMTIRGFAPVPGFGRITFEYDLIDDALARDRRGIPTDVTNNQWTIRVQGEL